MFLSDAKISYNSSILNAIPSLSSPNLSSSRILHLHRTFVSSQMPEFIGIRNFRVSANSSDRASTEINVQFPRDYSELLDQASKATEAALRDDKQLMEIEFPTAGLESVPGDGEGGIEMTESMQLIRQFCDCFVNAEKATRTRVFFPEANEVKFARKTVFEGALFKLDYLTKPSFFEDFGFVEKVKMADRVKPQDELFLVAYPYFNVNVNSYSPIQKCLWSKNFTRKLW